MNACNPLHFDGGACASALFGGTLDALTGWVWGLPVWLLIGLAIVVLGFAYRQVGLPGLAAAALGIGVLIGRRSVLIDHPAAARPRALTKSEIEALQLALIERGLYRGEIDGKFGAKSTAALLAYQRSRGEPGTARPTPAQLQALGVKIGGAP